MTDDVAKTMTDDKFQLTSGRPLLDYEREILTVLSEESAELIEQCSKVIVKVSKLLRFGVGNVNPDTLLVNTDELALELGDLRYMLDRATIELNFFSRDKIQEGSRRKAERFRYFCQYENPAG